MRNGLKIPESQQDLDDHSEEKDVIVNSQLKRFLGTSNNTRSKSYIKTGGFKKLTENSNEDESHDKGRELACNNIQEALEPSKEKLLNSSRYELSSQEQAEYLKKYGHLYTDVKKSSTSLAQVGRKSRLQIETNQEPLEGSLNSSRNDSVNVFEQLSPKNKSARRSIIAFKNINPINIEKAASSRNDHLRRRNTEIPVRINLAADNLTVSEFQSNMTEIRNKLKNYEKGVDDINAKLDIGSVEKIKALTKKVIDLNTELRLKEEEKLQMKQLMSDGLRIKEEECQAKIIEVKGLHLEELTKLKQQSESKLTSKRICWEEVRPLKLGELVPETAAGGIAGEHRAAGHERLEETRGRTRGIPAEVLRGDPRAAGELQGLQGEGLRGVQEAQGGPRAGIRQGEGTAKRAEAL